MNLGQFSISLAVKDLAVSKAFYENLGFTAFGGNVEHNYLIMKQGDTLVGLFQGMFDENILTFNPGWDSNASPVDPFDDVREIQKALKDQSVKLDTEAEVDGSGPGHILLKDPDGNVIMIDQHR